MQRSALLTQERRSAPVHSIIFVLAVLTTSSVSSQDISNSHQRGTNPKYRLEIADTERTSLTKTFTYLERSEQSHQVRMLAIQDAFEQLNKAQMDTLLKPSKFTRCLDGELKQMPPKH
ncbi:hypothetical protein GCE9029_00062 [Grimontia celer]|uniref:Uncharacterized protein n=1 Tax=Grimontia celer TaxID=1796497 RepID=A0A128ERK5_9GAMM|nr:hypothetical protein [Grimontia celer]CZF77193.1 hypothetical protein GCE9029_00062 [Grimontia celer]